ncbi:MAG: hypothetical protein HC896_09645 [Bacteroidales bacterium]|nr:hypothetical protein [Bacteroidales bacterium]
MHRHVPMIKKTTATYLMLLLFSLQFIKAQEVDVVLIDTVSYDIDTVYLPPDTITITDTVVFRAGTTTSKWKLMMGTGLITGSLNQYQESANDSTPYYLNRYTQHRPGTSFNVALSYKHKKYCFSAGLAYKIYRNSFSHVPTNLVTATKSHFELDTVGTFIRDGITEHVTEWVEKKESYLRYLPTPYVNTMHYMSLPLMAGYCYSFGVINAEISGGIVTEFNIARRREILAVTSSDSLIVNKAGSIAYNAMAAYIVGALASAKINSKVGIFAQASYQQAITSQYKKGHAASHRPKVFNFKTGIIFFL